MIEEKVFIKLSEIKLEALQYIKKGEDLIGGVIFCHPHPLYGGDMYNHVIEVAVKAAQEEGFSTLRFNFRGVGESEGSYGDGIGEMEDVKGVIDYFHLKLKDTNPLLIILGYSFGVRASFPVAVNDERIGGLIAISPAIEFDDFEYLKDCKKEKLFIAGDGDPYCPSNKLQSLFERLNEPKHLFIIRGADHFFFGQQQAIATPIKDFLRKIAKKRNL